MRVVVIGTGTIGSAIRKTLQENGHEVVSVGRTSGDIQADICDPSSLRKLFAGLGRFDAVANAAGDVFPGQFEELTDKQWAKSIASKGMGQINVVRASMPSLSCWACTSSWLQGQGFPYLSACALSAINLGCEQNW